jgi:hypothetical protein
MRFIAWHYCEKNILGGSLPSIRIVAIRDSAMRWPGIPSFDKTLIQREVL